MRPVMSLAAFVTAIMIVWGQMTAAVQEATNAGAHALSVEQASLAQSEGDWRPHTITLAPAKWIWLPSERTLPNTFVLFRKEIELPAIPTLARGWIAADSRYRLAINGNRVQWGPAPCDPRNLDADPIDMKPFLRPGKNVIAVEVLFYGHGDGTWPGGKPGLILNVPIKTPSGDLNILTDASWQSMLDRAHPPGHYKRWFLRALQEEFDARLHPYGWDAEGFAPDGRWTASMEIKCPADKPPSCRADQHWAADTVDRVPQEFGTLRARQIPMPRETIVTAKALAHSGRVLWKRDPEDWFDARMPDAFQVSRDPIVPPGNADSWELPATPDPREGNEATFEFHEQIVGFPRFTIDAPAGTIVEMMIQEGHDPEKTRWLDSHHFSWSRFVCREGHNEFEGADFESLRWLQLHIRNASRPVTVRGIGVRRRQFPWPNEPLIRTSEPTLQRLFDAGINTLRNSAIETLVDGMGRERQQYSGDGGHQLVAARYAFGESRIVARFLRTFSEGLTKSGAFLDAYPAYDRLARLPQRELDSSVWGPILDHGVQFNFDCWKHYMFSGDSDALREPYPRLVQFAGYIWGLRGRDGLLPVDGLGMPVVWIDFTAFKQQRHKICSFNLNTAAMYRHALAPMCDLMGNARLASEARERGDALLRATVQRFWSKEHHAFIDNLPWLLEEVGPRLSDRTCATAVLFDQCPGNDTAASVRALADCPPQMGLSYPCNAGWRYWALGKAGRADVILNEFRNKWAAMPSVAINNTIQEHWRSSPDSAAQWSHCALSPIYILFDEIVGLRPLEPGFARFQLRPQLGDLPDLEAIAHTPRGPILLQAKREGETHRVTVTFPAECEVELLLPSAGSATFEPLLPDHPVGLKRYRLPKGTASFQIPLVRSSAP
ncbi:MAG TPA: alpha-L-rhamnosidase C-terminal domain-containing protein [Verrucomicrobiae bacterium]|nr:alpha-L-rhamnosidase C-terminal domain-containing protein [Verrucomicrobiae bacterium]